MLLTVKDSTSGLIIAFIFEQISGADPETLLTGRGGGGGGGGGRGGGRLSYRAIFSIIDGTNCSPKAVLACRSVSLVFISFSIQ